MTAVGWLPATSEELFGPDATAEESYDVLTVDVPPAAWITALETARDRLGCTYFDWLSAVDEPGTGFRVTAHVAALAPVRRLLLRTTVPHDAPSLPSAVDVYAGAAWHERETYEMFGIIFEGHPALDHLLLPENFEGHPLRKDFVLAARVAKAWPGAKEPGESDHGGPKRRQMLPPGVPDPNEWGPLKGQLPPAPARGAGRAAGERPARGAARPAGERPVRRTRSASQGSASQPAAGAETPAAGAGGPAAPRRARSASEGSVSQSAAPGGTPAASRRTRTAADSPASRPVPGEPTAPAQKTEPDRGDTTPDTAPSAPRSTDAPWHHARPAFDEPAPEPSPEAAQASAIPGTSGSADKQKATGDEPQAGDDEPTATDDEPQATDDEPQASDDEPTATDNKPQATDDKAQPSGHPVGPGDAGHPADTENPTGGPQ
ncbi:NADH-quinone oxidoreductase subunit C [Streptomyces sp. NRRL B-1140]|uniref:NADH-quinone oxidoreductase subunit C n=1 Tax=Streptomyces sp. NRRL B-1140 TaxID=1415549 RepID=UPI00099D1014|nr:NADH-quinone oxidoreductase subunit C [Streptomyces sp. NRRL B-1140]